MRSFNSEQAVASTEKSWEEEILPTLSQYIKVPNLSPAFDKGQPELRAHERLAVSIIDDWCCDHAPRGLTVMVHQIPNRTPLIFMEFPGTDGCDRTVLLYGHLDKQPECGTWREGLSPWTPVREGDRLYGRGGADDGYAVFAAITALNLLHEQGIPHARCVILIEASEESGSPDLPAYMEKLAPEIGKPDLVICLDSSCGDYERLWRTTSLRGVVMGTLRVDVLEHGVHSGSAGGLVDSSFLILSELLLGLKNILRVPSREPAERRKEAHAAGSTFGFSHYDSLPWIAEVNALRNPASGFGPDDWIIENTWRYSLEVTGIDGIPPLDRAANVLRPYTTAMLSIRIPPNVEPNEAVEMLNKYLHLKPRYGVKITFTPKVTANGWDSPPLAPWLAKSLDEASNQFFGQPSLATGEGGTIPFMSMLGQRFPEAQFVVTGVLGPESNAHGPNEFLHIPTAKKLTACIAMIMADHAASR